MANIGIDGGNYSPGAFPHNGIQRLLKGFIDEATKDTKLSLHYYTFTKQSINIPNICYHQLPATLFGSVLLPLSLLKNHNNVFLAFSAFIPSALRFTNIKKIAFLYDLGFIKYPQLYANPSRMKQDTLQLIHSADKIITLADYSKRELVDVYPEAEKKIVRIYAGLDHMIAAKVLKKQTENYFLYVGVIKPVKNILKLIQLFALFLQKTSNREYKLILIGSKEEDYFQQILIDTTYKDIKNHILFLENVDDESLRIYYLNATAVLNVSWEEGFCFPVLEALALGKTVVVNNHGIYKEYVPHFSNLRISNSDQDFVRLMSAAPDNIPAEIPKEFRWNHFYTKICSVIQSI